jgi:minichromosome maintenance protein 10
VLEAFHRVLCRLWASTRLALRHSLEKRVGGGSGAGSLVSIPVFHALANRRSVRTYASSSSFVLATRSGSGQTMPSGKYDPKKKQGLLPTYGRRAAPRGIDNGGGGATYVVGGGAVVHPGRESSGPKRFFGDEHLSEIMGRHRVGKKAKRLEEKRTDEALEKILKRDMEGGTSGSVGAKAMAKLRRSEGVGAGGGIKKGQEGEEEREKRAAEKRSMAEAIVNRRMGMGILGKERVREDPIKRVSGKGAIHLLMRVALCVIYRRCSASKS